MPGREHDETLPEDARLIRVLVQDGWITTKGGSERVASFAFLDTRSHEVSCFLDSPEARAALQLRYAGRQVAVVTVKQARDSGHIVARDDEGGYGIPGHVVLVQVQARPESKEHVRKTKQLAATASIENL